MIAGSTTVDEMAVLISKNLEEYQNLEKARGKPQML